MFVEDWLFPSIPAQFTCSHQHRHHDREVESRSPNSIVYSSRLGDDTVDESVDEALISDITGSRENNDVGIDDGDFFSRLLKLGCIDVCNGDAFASACCESLCNGSSDSCRWASKSESSITFESRSRSNCLRLTRSSGASDKRDAGEFVAVGQGHGRE